MVGGRVTGNVAGTAIGGAILHLLGPIGVGTGAIQVAGGLLGGAMGDRKQTALTRSQAEFGFGALEKVTAAPSVEGGMITAGDLLGCLEV